ncbi:winged helix-turn-helix transcriptional regulator [Chryseobacterium arachidis]|uniref:winged helix-turn-helix transcriptional regulator n=1 Tax=Chryseobacterium arachidis TaxID=1416778 RepID=UPI00360AABE5
MIIVLISGHTRFNEIQRRLNGISATVLSSELKSLEMNLLVKRVVHPEQTPVIVEYVPTAYAESLKEVVTILARWGVNHKRVITQDSKTIIK